MRHTENTALSEVVDRVADRLRGGMHVQELPLAAVRLQFLPNAAHYHTRTGTFI